MTHQLCRATLRRASIRDLQFAIDVRTDTMRSYVVETWGFWDHAAVREQVQEDIGAGRSEIIEVDGEAVGLWRLDQLRDHFQLDQIFIVANQQRRGIGASLVAQAMDQARLAGVPLQLWVLRVNPALHFYTRLGFVIASSTVASHLLRFEV
ncbi:MAG: GNAT family N-acetyltransferase [Betaproteobacteria bacterium]